MKAQHTQWQYYTVASSIHIITNHTNTSTMSRITTLGYHQHSAKSHLQLVFAVWILAIWFHVIHFHQLCESCLSIPSLRPSFSRSARRIRFTFLVTFPSCNHISGHASGQVTTMLYPSHDKSYRAFSNSSTCNWQLFHIRPKTRLVNNAAYSHNTIHTSTPWLAPTRRIQSVRQAWPLDTSAATLHC